MTIGLALLLLGLMLIYAGIKGQSIRGMLLGRMEPSKTPKPVQRQA